MDLEVIVSGSGLSDERITDSAASLLKELRLEVEPTAKFVSNKGEPGSRGDFVSFSRIALALVTGGAASKFITALFGFLSINRKLRLKVKKSNGETMELSLDFLDRNGSDKAMEIVRDFLAK